MATKATKEQSRAINVEQFRKQLEQADIATLQELKIDDERSVWIRLGSTIDAEDSEEFSERLENAESTEELATIVLDYYPNKTAEQQKKIWRDAGLTWDLLIVMFTQASKEQADRLGKTKVGSSRGRKK